MAKTLKMTFGYGQNQESTRNYSFTVDDSLAAACKSKIIALNDSLESGDCERVNDVFIDEDNNGLSKIIYASVESTVTEVLDISGGASSAQEG